jgi:hypothetical protein
VTLSPLGASATNGPVLLDPDDKCGAVGGMRIGRGTEVLGENLPQCHFLHHKSHMTLPWLEPGPPQWEAGQTIFTEHPTSDAGYKGCIRNIYLCLLPRATLRDCVVSDSSFSFKLR